MDSFEDVTEDDVIAVNKYFDYFNAKKLYKGTGQIIGFPTTK